MYVAVFALTGGDCYQGAITKDGHFELRYDDPTVYGPYLFPPLVEGGAHASIDASSHGGGCSDSYSFAAVASSDPTIADFTYDGSRIQVTTGHAGTVELQLLDDKGARVDSVDVTIEAVATVGPGLTSASVIAGGTYRLPVTMYGATGDELGGERGMLQVSTAGVVSVMTTDAFAETAIDIAAADIGDGTVTLAAPSNVTATIAIKSVAPEAITAIELDPRRPPSYDPDHVRWTVYTVARADGELVYGATCSWQVSSADVSIDWQRPVTNLADTVTSEDSAFHLGKAGSYTATCTIGAAQLDVPLHR